MTQNIDQHEVNKFAEIAENWWDPTGDFKPLHVINPLRANYINQKICVEGLKVLDVGCGGGLLAEALNAKGARVPPPKFKLGALTLFNGMSLMNSPLT